MRKAKFILLLLCALVGLALLVQNDHQIVGVRIGWMTVQTPLAVMSLVLLIGGFVAGAAVALSILSPAPESKREHEKTSPGTEEN